eukprot:gnl/MRDRNA2_/MRDRNA2_169735_c0_seq1.p1 gnl/MRDRNA2_/MRDRNA2_169735_c0~~gnl/MRDRNA2_/MRDRNA2_169735_c0_seq1.p1  ORF type:complete len:120 (+),score=21.90 gnl/MRDRNA2_/MRDRNA2_169735_c0_seq1:514-873(+)
MIRGKKGHTFGTRDGYIIGRILTGMAESLVPADQANWQAFLNEHSLGSQRMAVVAFFCTIQKNCDKQWTRIRLVLPTKCDDLLEKISIAIVKQGGHRQWGAAPPAAMERELQEILANRM